MTRSAEARDVSDGVATAVQQRIAGADDLSAVGPTLEASERATGRPVIVMDLARRVRAASNPRLASAEFDRATPEGRLTLRIRDEGAEAVMEVLGPPTAVLRDRGGAPVGSLHVLPAPEREEIRLQERALVSVLVLATLSTAAAGLALAFVVARRVLEPVSELTGAVRRMEQARRAPHRSTRLVHTFTRSRNPYESADRTEGCACRGSGRRGCSSRSR